MNDTQLLLSRLEDCIESYYSGESASIGFLNESEIAICVGYLKNRYIDFILYGGYDNASRAYVCLGDDTDSLSISIQPLLITTSSSRDLTHRDYLGSLMGLGLKRECIGDILILSEGKAVAFVRKDISEYIKTELTSVGHESVKVSDYTGDDSDFIKQTEELTFNVSSVRIDNVISAICRCSRSDASQLILSDKVFINHLNVRKTSQSVNADDVISVRGFGKYIFSGICGTTRKGNLIISVLHYI